MRLEKEIREMLANCQEIKEITKNFKEVTKKDKIQNNTMINTLRWVLEIDEREI